MINKKKIIKLILVIVAIIYAAYVMYSQQKVLNSYSKQQDYYKTKIETASFKNKDLIEMRDNLNSKEYIEKLAREKLDMYYPNEKVYIDIAK